MFKGELPSIEIRLGEKVYEVSVQDEVSINESKLVEEFLNQAAKYAWVATLHELAMKAHSGLKLELGVKEAELDKDIREKFAAAGEKVTETRIQQTIKQDSEYKDLQKQLINAREKTGILSGLKEAFQQRGQMLSQLGAWKRAEMQSTMTNLPA